MTRVAPAKFMRFVVALSAIAGVWMILLPWIARQPAERDGWKALHQAGIDPSAMYYSELEAMAAILERLKLSKSGKTSSEPQRTSHDD